MAKQYKIQLSERQRFDVYMFVANSVQPKNRQDARALKGVFETFGLDEIQERIEGLAEGAKFGRKDCSDEMKPFETGSVDLNTLLGYLDGPGATAVGSLWLLDVSDELQRAKDGPRLEAVPEDKGA